MKLEKRKLSEIKPFWRNPRKNENAVTAVIESIKKYGYQSPIIIDTDNVIIAGHTRYQALARLDYAEADVVMSNMSADKAKEYRIIDNKTSELAGWDEAKLLAELREIGDMEEFNEIFPELKIDMDTFKDNIKPVNSDQLTDLDETLNNQFSDASNTINNEKRIKEITCPSCGEIIELYV